MFKILTLGESTTFGWNAGEKDTYPAQLQAYLQEAGIDSVCVINAGVPSYTSLQVLIYLKELLPRIKPDLVIVNIMWNDIWYSSLRNWFPEILVLRRPSAWRRFLLKHSGLYVLLTMQSDDEEHVDVFNREALEFYSKNLEEMVTECRKINVEIAFMRPPFDASCSIAGSEPILGQKFFSTPFLIGLLEKYTGAVQEVARKNDIPVINHRVSSDHMDKSSMFGDPLHPTAAGNRLIGEDVGNFLLEHMF
jgi:lysophospholipase L1-like esterase